MIREWWENFCDSEAPIFVVVGVILVVMIVLAIHESSKADVRWREYAISHHCEAKGIEHGHILPVAGGKGGFTVSSDQTIYVCDGGEIVIR